jgi:hypothetical protein
MVGCLAAPDGRTVGHQPRVSTSERSLDLIDIDVSVVDRSGRPVPGLALEDFRVEEDGRPVELETIVPVSPTAEDAFADPRSLVLLLDDVAVAPAGTTVVQNIARAFLTEARPGDEIAVVRMRIRTDEPYGDLQLALDRIEGYRAGVGPSPGRELPEDTLRLLSS